MTAEFTLPSSVSEPTIVFVESLLRDIHEGRLLVPRFQRGFEWNGRFRKLLIDSVLRRIAVGSVMIWRTVKYKNNLIFRDVLGPFHLPSPQKEIPFREFLLDGEHRLFTLYFALYPQTALDPAAGLISAVDDDLEDPAPLVAEDFEFYVDLTVEDVSHALVCRKELTTIENHHLPLRSVLHDDYRAWQRKLLTECAPDTAKLLLDRADGVVSAVRGYKLPVLPLASEDLKFMTTTFQRVNTQHKSMGAVDVMRVLSWDENFDFGDAMKTLKNECEPNELATRRSRSLSDDLILVLVRDALEIPVDNEDPALLGTRIRDAIGGPTAAFSRARDAALGAIDFLRVSLEVGVATDLEWDLIVLTAAGLQPHFEVPRHLLEEWTWFWMFVAANWQPEFRMRVTPWVNTDFFARAFELMRTSPSDYQFALRAQRVTHALSIHLENGTPLPKDAKLFIQQQSRTEKKLEELTGSLKRQCYILQERGIWAKTLEPLEFDQWISTYAAFVLLSEKEAAAVREAMKPSGDLQSVAQYFFGLSDSDNADAHATGKSIEEIFQLHDDLVTLAAKSRLSAAMAAIGLDATIAKK